MVCRHCINSVRHIASDHLKLPVEAIELGSASFTRDLTDDETAEFDRMLAAEGFGLVRSREATIVEAIKHTLIDISRREGGPGGKLSELLPEALHISYASLSRIFSETEGRSIENYLIALRVERVKELIKYHNLSLDEIAWQTGYSSAAHLSRQFKQQTGLTPGEFRRIGSRRPLPEV